MTSTVKCADCGFLALLNIRTRQLVDVEDSIRAGGGIPSDSAGYFYDERPFCFIRKFNFCDEVGPRADNGARIAVISKQRDCDGFTEWHQGFSPKEHVEMTLLEEQREWQRKREEADMVAREQQATREHKWRLEDAQTAREWHTEDISIARQSNTSQIRVAILSAVVGFAAALAAVALERLLNNP